MYLPSGYVRVCLYVRMRTYQCIQCICMYVCVYVLLVCIYMCIHTHTYTYVHVLKNSWNNFVLGEKAVIDTHTHTHTHTHRYTGKAVATGASTSQYLLHTCIHTNLPYVHNHSQIPSCTKTYAHTYIPTHIHIHRQGSHHGSQRMARRERRLRVRSLNFGGKFQSHPRQPR